MEIFSQTPWWVFVLFAFLVLFGYKSTQPRILTFKRLIILPTIFTIWNIFWLAERVHLQLHLSIFWIGGIVLGFALGWLSVRSWVIHVERHRRILILPGTWSTFVLILVVFAVRYFFTYHYSVHPDTAPRYFRADATISGVITGIFIGRSLELYRKYRKQQENF